MEVERGNDVTFINPEPGFVVKTKLKSSDLKVFINICQSAVIDEPKASRPEADSNGGKSGVRWAVPNSIAVHREDLDSEGQSCIVYDAVFHPTALRVLPPFIFSLLSAYAFHLFASTCSHYPLIKPCLPLCSWH